MKRQPFVRGVEVRVVWGTVCGVGVWWGGGGVRKGCVVVEAGHDQTSDTPPTPTHKRPRSSVFASSKTLGEQLHASRINVRVTSVWCGEGGGEGVSV